MIVTVIGQVLVLIGLSVIGLMISRFTCIERALACLLVGFAVGMSVDALGYDTGLRAHSFKELIFFVFLPILVFEAAWQLKPALLKKWMVPILLLATVGVCLNALISALLIFIGIGHPIGFPWIAALLTAVILSATDPVSVTSKLQQMKAPEDLVTLFEGESLFNDASVVVLFTIVLGFATQTLDHEGRYFSFFSTVFMGGLVFGLVCGLITTAVIILLKNPPAAHFILVSAAFSSFYIAEHVLHVSGILAVMMSAVICRVSLREVESVVAAGVAQTWAWLGLLLNSVLFVIMGIVMDIYMFKHQWLSMIIAITATLFARFMMIKLISIVSAFCAKPMPKTWQLVMAWGGLKGSIAIALVLSLPVDLPYWWVIQSMTFGVVAFSLLVQGVTMPLLIKRYV